MAKELHSTTSPPNYEIHCFKAIEMMTVMNDNSTCLRHQLNRCLLSLGMSVHQLVLVLALEGRQQFYLVFQLVATHPHCNQLYNLIQSVLWLSQ